MVVNHENSVTKVQDLIDDKTGGHEKPLELATTKPEAQINVK
jgi:hypothetical protein